MRKSVIYAVSVLSLMLASCVDNDYDLSKDIDLTIKVGGSNFAIPGGETEAIPLSKILKVEDGDLVKIDPITGNYYLLKSGEPTYTSIHVNAFSLAEPVINPVSRQLSFTPQSAPMLKSTNTVLEAVLPNDQYDAGFVLSGLDLPVEVRTLSEITSKMTITIDFSYSKGIVRNLWIDDIAIKLPDYLIIKDENEAGNVMHIKNVQIPQGTSSTFDIPVEGLKVTPSQFDYDKHTLSMSGNVVMNGKVRINSSDIINPGNVSSNPSLDFTAHVSVKDAVKNDGRIHILGIKGKVSPDINIDIDPVELTGLPDFLTDKEVVLDASNPMVYFNVNNSTPVKTQVNGTFTSWYADGSAPVNVDFPQFDINAQSNTLFCLSPSTPSNKDAEHIVVENLPRLIDKIPTEIRIKAEAVAADEESQITLGSDYTITTEYEVNVPFQFGSNLKIVYNDTIGNWHDDIEKYEFSRINATATVVNNIPLDVVVSAIALGETEPQGNRPELDGITANVKVPAQGDNNTIHANSSADIVIEITETVPGTVKQLDGLILRIEATGSNTTPAENRYLNKNQTIQLKEVKLKVPGGMKIDLN